MNETDIKKNGTEHDMLSGPVARTFARYSLPWVLSMVATGSATIMDGIFVGRYAGAMSLAGVNLVVPAWSFVSGLGIMLATGGSVRAGRHMGEGNRERASAVLIKTMLALMVLTVLICGAAFILRGPFLDFLGADEALRPYSSDYLTVLLLFGPVFPLCYALSYFIRVHGRPVLAGVGMGLCAALNVALDALLVGVWGMGVRGAALATGLAYALPCLILASHFFSRRSSYRLLPPRAWGRWSEVLFTGWNGASEFINEISAGIVILLFNRILISRLGPDGVAAFTVVNYATLLGLTMFYGIGDSLAPIISVNRGARDRARVSAFLRTALVAVVTLGVGFFVFLSLGPHLLTALFLPDAPAASALTLSFFVQRREHGACLDFYRHAVGRQLHVGGGRPQLCAAREHADAVAASLGRHRHFLCHHGVRGADAAAGRGAVPCGPEAGPPLRPEALREEPSAFARPF